MLEVILMVYKDAADAMKILDLVMRSKRVQALLWLIETTPRQPGQLARPRLLSRRGNPGLKFRPEKGDGLIPGYPAEAASSLSRPASKIAHTNMPCIWPCTRALTLSRLALRYQSP